MAGSSSLSERSHSTDGEKTSQLKIRQGWCGKSGPARFPITSRTILEPLLFFRPRPLFLHARLIFAWPCFLDVPTILGSRTVYSTKNESYWVVFSCGTVYHATLCGSVLKSVGEVLWQVWLKSVIVREHPYTIPDGGGWYCHIGVEQVCAAVKGMVFRQCTLGKGTVKIREFGYHLPGNWSIGLRF